MDNYVEQTWQRNLYSQPEHGKVAQVLAWSVGVIVVIAFVAYSSRDYWYSYVSAYL